MFQAIIDVPATGRNIGRLLRENNITVNEATRLLGLSTTNAVYKWIRGETLPALDNLVSLSAALGVPLDSILVVRISGEKREDA